MIPIKPDNADTELDLRAYPNQTAVFFWIIVLVLLGVMVVGAIGPSPLLMWPTTLTILILPVRALLAWPDQEIKKRQDRQATAVLTTNGALPRLQTTLTALATSNGYPEPIKIIIGSATDKMNAVGSWRRHYLFVGQEIAQQLDNDLQTPGRQAVAEAALLHEIAHFLHHDVQRVGYTRELLRSSFVVILWWMFFLLGWLGFSNQVGEAFLHFDFNQIPDMDPNTQELLAPIVTLSPEQRTEIVTKVQTLSFDLVLNYVFNAFTPIIWMGLFLWLFFWRRMLRLQEHYADYFVNKVLSQPEALRSAWLNYEPQSLRLVDTKPKLPVKLQTMWQELLFQISEWPPLAIAPWYKRLRDGGNLLKRWFAYHPTFDDRSTLLLNPMGIYTSWQSLAISTLALVLALEVLLTTPIIGYHVGSTYIIHFATLAIFILLSTWALPLLVQHEAVKLPLQKSLILIYGVRFAWIGMTFILLLVLSKVAPDYTLEILNAVVFAGARFSTNPTSLPVDDPLAMTLSIIPSYIGLQVLSLVAVILALFVYFHWQRQAVETNLVVDWRQRHWQLVFALSVSLATLVLTPLSDVLQGEFTSLLYPLRLLSYAIGLGCIGWLMIWGRRGHDKGKC